MRRWRRLLCALGVHSWEHVGKAFAYCDYPDCQRVLWFPGTRTFMLDICNSEWVDDYEEVQ